MLTPTVARAYLEEQMACLLDNPPLIQEWSEATDDESNRWHHRSQACQWFHDPGVGSLGLAACCRALGLRAKDVRAWALREFQRHLSRRHQRNAGGHGLERFGPVGPPAAL